MASNGNQPPFNNSWRTAANAETSYQLAPLMSFTSSPLQPLCNVAVPTSNFHQNGAYNHPQSSQIADLTDYYESRIYQLNQEIYHLNGEQQKFFSLKAKCAKLNDQLLKKDAELEALKQSKGNSRKSVRDAITQTYFDKYSRQYEKVDKIKVEHKDLSHEVKRYKDKFERAQKENDTLMKTRLSEDSCKNHSLQISELRQNNKKLREENEVLKENLKGRDTDQLKSELNTSRAQLESRSVDLQKAREDKSDIVAERDRLKADLAIANETIEISVERSSKLGLKLKIQEDKCKVYIAEMDKLKQDLAQFENLKNELDHAKNANERLSGKNKELEKEAKRLWNKIYVSSNDEQGPSEAKNEDEKPGPTATKKKKANNPK